MIEENIKAVRSMLALAHVTMKPGLRSAAYRDVGVYLGRLRRGRSKAEWVDLIQCNCGLSASRAYELMAVAEGKRSVESLQAEKAARARKHYARQSNGLAHNTPAEKDVEGEFSRPKKLSGINPDGQRWNRSERTDHARTCPHCGWEIAAGVVSCRVCEVARAAKRLAKRRAREAEWR
jgi:hypothetical protein